MEVQKTAMMHKAIDLGWNKSPLNKGETHVDTDGISVKLIYWPSDEKMLKQAIAKMVLSTTGCDSQMEIPDELGEELFRGGLQTGLEVPSVVFEVSGVSRQLTHELVRTRKAVFHQQSMRHTDMGNKFNVRMPKTIRDSKTVLEIGEDSKLLRKYFGSVGSPEEIWQYCMDVCRETYAILKDANIPYQDARTACPIATETYIIASYPLSEFINVYSYRACRMFLWEIQHVFKLMREEVLKKFPWMEPYIKVSCERSKRCQYQGWESTEFDCELPWKNDRVYKPNLDLIGLKGKAYGNESKKGEADGSTQRVEKA